ncbi:MAG: hypothetical protein NT049_11285 [Planctomycetota bacterium]|nr:hypothetical protein [Planctomycetota bacterium]
MFANFNQAELFAGVLWAAYVVVSLSPITLLFIGRRKRSRRADIGPSQDQLAPILKHLLAVHSTKSRPLAAT